MGRAPKTPIFVTAVTIGTYSDAPPPVPPVPLGMRPLLGTILTERGLIDPARLAEALAEAQATGRRVGEVLLQKGWIYEQELARALAHQYGLEYVDLETTHLNPRDAALLDPEVGQRCRAVPLCVAGDELVVAVADPALDLVEELRARLPYPLRIVVAEPTLVQQAWDALLAGQAP
jgi:Type II secretion system (T2SS), protein E, N-terminal domain